MGYLYKVFLTFCLTLSLLNSGITNSFSLGGKPKSFLLLASPILKKSIKSIILYGTYLVLNTLFIIVLVTINIWLKWEKDSQQKLQVITNQKISSLLKNLRGDLFLGLLGLQQISRLAILPFLLFLHY